jgi:hypothetical protein
MAGPGAELVSCARVLTCTQYDGHALAVCRDCLKCVDVNGV